MEPIKQANITGGGSEYKGPAPLHWIERTWEFQSRDMTDEEVLVEPNYWYQGVLEWCKKNPEGMRMLRELKLDRILDENKINE